MILANFGPTSGSNATPRLCPVAQGWFHEGGFDALMTGREPWRGSKRSPSNPYDPNILSMVPGSAVKAGDALCDASDKRGGESVFAFVGASRAPRTAHRTALRRRARARRCFALYTVPVHRTVSVQYVLPTVF